MSAEIYNNVLEHFRQLSLDEQLQLLEDLIRVIREQAVEKRQHSFLELRGLGKEFWEDVDVDQYIENEERLICADLLNSAEEAASCMVGCDPVGRPWLLGRSWLPPTQFVQGWIGRYK